MTGLNGTAQLSRLKIVIASHEFVSGPSQALEEYLAPRVKDLVVIQLPFYYAPDIRPGVRRFHLGVMHADRRHTFPRWVNREPTIWLRDAAFLTWAFLRWGRSCDLFVGVDCFNALAGVAFRAVRLANRPVVYYPIDFSPKRFDNRLLNSAYHLVEETASRRADCVWNASPHMEDERVKRSGPRARAPQTYVPIGVNRLVEQAQVQPLARLVFLGNLIEKQGVQHVIAAMPEIMRTVPGAELVIIGTGEFEATLHQLAAASPAASHIRFLGYIQDHHRIDTILAEGGLGLATYDAPVFSHTRFADQGKIKNYLAAALPILVTDAPPIARELVGNGSALLVEPDASSIAQGALTLLTDDELFCKSSAAALRFAQPYTWRYIFGQAFKFTFAEA